MRVAIYTRVSTTDQNTAMQIEELRDYCARRGLDIATEYTDVVSGAKESRPGLTRMMADARRRKFDAVLVWRFDRAARSIQHLIGLLAELNSLGVEFISIREAIDTGTPSGRMIFAIVGALAQFERELLQERVRAGVASAQRRGVRFGRKPKTIVDPERIRAMRETGASFRDIARELGTSVGTAHSICAAAK